METTFALIKSGVFERRRDGSAISIIENYFSIIRWKAVQLHEKDKFAELYLEHLGRPYYAHLLQSVSGHVMALALSSDHAILKWRDLIGPTDPVIARAERPSSLRALFAGDFMPDNAFHGSDSEASAKRELAIFFPNLRS